jgi:hypothetical protein
MGAVLGFRLGGGGMGERRDEVRVMMVYLETWMQKDSARIA